jgi:hypothetical protein
MIVIIMEYVTLVENAVVIKVILELLVKIKKFVLIIALP